MVFYTREGQTFIRKKGTVTKPQSEAQKAVRGAFREAAACWKGLSSAAKEPWRRQGNTMAMTGYNAFLKINIPRLKQGLAMAISVPGEGAAARDDRGCREFMASINAMVERISGQYRRASRSFIPAEKTLIEGPVTPEGGLSTLTPGVSTKSIQNFRSP